MLTDDPSAFMYVLAATTMFPGAPIVLTFLALNVCGILRGGARRGVYVVVTILITLPLTWITLQYVLFLIHAW